MFLQGTCCLQGLMRVGGLVYRCGCCIVGNVHRDVDGVEECVDG